MFSHDAASRKEKIVYTSGKHVHVHFKIYKIKLGYTGVYLFFLFLLQNIDCVTIYVLSKNKHDKKYIKIFLMKFFNFYS